MEGHPNGFDYIQDDLGGYDELMNHTGWPADADHQQQPFSFTQPSQDPYLTRFAASQPANHGHYNIGQQQSYPPVPYANSPYASQFQHARPSDVFGPTSYNVDPSLQGSPYHGHENSFSFAKHPTENATIAPQNLQYGMNQNPAMNPGMSSSAVQRTVNGMGNNFHQSPHNQSAMFYPNNQTASVHLNPANNVRYPALPNEILQTDSKPYIKTQQMDPVPSVQAAPRSQQVGLVSTQNSLRITRPELLAAKDPSSRKSLECAPYLVFEDESTEIPPGLKNTLPKYHPRKSRSGKDLVPGFDTSRSSAPARISTKRGRPPKESKPTSTYKGTSQSSRAVAIKTGTPREGDQLASVKSPSTPEETSSSDEESNSEYESDEEEDEIPLVDISTVRGHVRPTTMPEATRWDAIEIIWKDPNSSPSNDIIKDAIEKFANFISAQRVELKTNATKIDEAASRPAELQRLRDERTVLLASLYQIIDAANQHGYPPIVKNLGGHHKLVNGLTTTLIECIKANDWLGQLPKAVFSLLAKFETMSDELLQKLKFDSIQKRWNKKGDDQIKKDIIAILANTTNAKEKAAKAKKTSEQSEKEKQIREKLEQSKSRAAETAVSQASSPAKRPHEGDGPNGKPSKKIAADIAGTTSLASKSAPPKRTANNLLGITSKPVPKPVPKKREPSPPTESKVGALLASIAKPPEAPKVPEAPPRPPETPEEKARRERKESRRHLRVKFKEGQELEQIRLFKHERAEDEGRQDEMVRDAHEHRLEGMMHKKRLSEVMDEDEDYQPSEPDLPYPELIPIDFSNLNKLTPLGETYVTRGGSRTFTTPEQNIQRQREGVELMVIYTVPSDIPSTPKELTNKESSSMDGMDNPKPEHLLQLPSEPWLVQRLQEIQQYGPEGARHVFQSRQSPSKPSSAVSSILQQLVGPAQPMPQNPLDKMDPAAYANIIRIVKSLKGKPYPPTEPPDWMTTQAQRDEWMAGYMRDMAVKEKAEAAQRAAQMQAAQLQPPPMLPQHFAQQVPMAFPLPIPQPSNAAIPQVPQIPDITQQVQSFLAGYQNGENRGAQPQQYDYSSWAGNSANSQTDSYSNSIQQQPRWDGNWNNENTKAGRSHEKKQRGHNQKQGSNTNNSIFDERGEYKGKKKPCRFYQDGKCAKGAACTFLHDD